MKRSCSVAQKSKEQNSRHKQNLVQLNSLKQYFTGRDGGSIEAPTVKFRIHM